MDKQEKTKKILQDGEPCKHKGCKNHITHPCEKCDRMQARGKVDLTNYFEIYLEQ